jgi:ferric-dicitrate binding protein FerR (iron transport regulator)
MPSDAHRLQELLDKYLQNACSPAELEEFWRLMSAHPKDGSLDTPLAALWQSSGEGPRGSEADKERILRRITGREHEKTVSFSPYDAKGRRRRIFLRVAAAAAFAGLVVLAYGLLPTRPRPVAGVAAVHEQAAGRIVPGGTRAVLTLADGTTIHLDSARQGTLARQGSVKVLKVAAGSLAYDVQPNGPAHRHVGYNILTTPRGGQYELTLSDGTKVWLNAASSIRFPAVFAAADRVVQITGEAYFEVAKDPGKPFKVSVGGMTVEVLGTRFNVMAYSDEAAIKTTLVEGSVKVAGETKTIRLAPGQQAQLSGGGMTLVSQANVSEAVAWKDGFFEFDDSGVADIMRQIARWYDVTVVYSGVVPAGHITGKIPRSTDLSNILKMMQLSGVHFTVKGREVDVL